MTCSLNDDGFSSTPAVSPSTRQNGEAPMDKTDLIWGVWQEVINERPIAAFNTEGDAELFARTLKGRYPSLAFEVRKVVGVFAVDYANYLERTEAEINAPRIETEPITA